MSRIKLGGSAHYSQLNLRLREAFFISTFALSAFLLIAFLTFHHTDPGWSQTGSSETVANLGGRVGAWFADLFLYLFGYLAYSLPLMMCAFAWLVFRDGYYQNLTDLRLITVRSIGFILFLTAGTGLVNLMLPAYHQAIPFCSGGILGAFIEKETVTFLNVSGGSVILFTMLLIGTTFATGISWLGFAEKVGIFAITGVPRFIRWLSRQSTNLRTRIDNQEPAIAASNVAVNLDKPAKKSPVIAKAKVITEPTIDVAVERPALASSAKVAPSPLPAKPVVIDAVPEPILADNFNFVPPSFVTHVKGTFPSLDLLDEAVNSKDHPQLSKEQLQALSHEVEIRLQDFGIAAQVVAVHPGPVITRFELSLAPGVKVSRITTLSKDLARSLSTISVRVVEVIPGKAVIGLEIPNVHRKIVRLREILASVQYKQARSPLSIALGSDIAGHPVVIDIAKMPHLLIAGTTGAGKSVSVNVMLLSLLYKASPEEVRLILIDPKMLELSIYDGIPHLLTPVVTDMKDAANALRWCVAEMDRRYRIMAHLGVRNLASFNQRIHEANEKGEELLDPFYQAPAGQPSRALETLPYIVVVVDEFADMMMVVGKKVEELIARIAQKARAAGIHLVLATQRPSVDVITGLIKSNIPTRIAFQVSSRIDSRTILDQQGAEQLLGHGDMLYLPPGTGVPVRVHGAFVADEEVHRVVQDWRSRCNPTYIADILVEQGSDELQGQGILSDEDTESDPLYDQAVRIVTETRRASISNIQRRLKIGYNRAARMIEAMERVGIVSPMEQNGNREVLVPQPVVDEQ